MHRQSSNRLIVVAAITIALLAMALPLGFACDTGGKSRPEAGFSAEPTSGAAPLQVQFSDRSTGEIANWAWDFDNDGVPDSTEPNPSYTYETPGEYTVSLEVIGPGGSDREIKAQYIEVAGPPPAPEAGFSAEPTSGPVPLEVQFTDQSTGDIASWAWNFGDGVSSTEQNASHTYQYAGTYTVSLTVTNLAGSDTETRASHITVYGTPVAAFTATPASGPAPLAVQFTDQSTGVITDWEWDFDNDGTVDSTEQNPSHTYNSSGTYTVYLKVTNPVGSDTEVKVEYVEVTTATAEEVIIGFMGDFTASAASTCSELYKGLADYFKMVEEDDPIPGLEVKMITYDTKMDYSRAPVGYEWLKGQGAHIFFNFSPIFQEILLYDHQDDEIPSFTLASSPAIVGQEWVYTFSIDYAGEAEAIMGWIFDSWEYDEMGRSPKVGHIGVSGYVSTAQVTETLEELLASHPDKFELFEEVAPPGATVWAVEIDRLKDCDIIIVSLVGPSMASFLKEARARGYEGQFLGMSLAFVPSWELVKAAVPTEEIYGALAIHPHALWTDDTPFVDQVRESLSRYRPSEVQALQAGLGYMNGQVAGLMLADTIRRAAEEVGAENVDGLALNNALANIAITLEGWGEPWKCHEGSNILHRMVRVIEYRAADDDWYAITDWFLPPSLGG